MILSELYNKIILTGINQDPRPRAEIEAFLAEKSKTFAELSPHEKKYFDKEKLTNPYSDTRILNGTGQEKIENILVGIDVETQDLLLANYLRSTGKKIDAVLSHHPEGKALSELSEVMEIQEEVVHKLGVPINVAQDLLAVRIGEVKRALLPLNHARTIQAAKLLSLPFLCSHTPADNCVQKYLEGVFSKEKPQLLEDIINLLLQIPEYQSAAKAGVGPEIVVGSKNRKAGKLLVDMTGGTSGSEEIYASLQSAGIGTIVAMHMGEKHRKEAEKNHVNVIIAGHMASDCLGMNLMLDDILSEEIQILSFSGFERVQRHKKKG